MFKWLSDPNVMVVDQYEFAPCDDITALELALILTMFGGKTPLNLVAIDQGAVMDKRIAKHFRYVGPDKI